MNNKLTNWRSDIPCYNMTQLCIYYKAMHHHEESPADNHRNDECFPFVSHLPQGHVSNCSHYACEQTKCGLLLYRFVSSNDRTLPYVHLLVKYPLPWIWASYNTWCSRQELRTVSQLCEGLCRRSDLASNRAWVHCEKMYLRKPLSKQSEKYLLSTKSAL